MKVHRFSLVMLEKTLQAMQRKWEFSFKFFMNLQYKKTNTINQDEMGLPFHLFCALFCDRLLQRHSTNLEQGYDFKQPREEKD